MGVAERERLLEREQEVTALQALLDAAVAGAGGVAVIEGQAGIGKTRLLAEGRRQARARAMAVMRARGSDLEREFAYGVVRQLFEPVLTREADERVALLRGAAAHAAPVFAASEQAAGESGAAPSATALDHGLFWLVANFADRRPLLVEIDDAQWADEASLRFLHYLARRAGELSMALVLAVRRGSTDVRGELVVRIASEPGATVLALHALSGAASAVLVRSLLAEEASEQVCEACFVATGGNPLLLRELTGALNERGVPAELDRVGRLVPEAVARHVLVRLARRPPAAAALARAAAVFGDGAEVHHAAALAGLDESETAEAIDALVSADILAPHRPLEFVHPLLREVILAELAPGERAVAHRRAARLLADAGADPERIASQLLACEPVGDAWAIESLRAAARGAQARGSAHSAVTYLTRALAEPSAADGSAALLELGLAELSAALPTASDHLAGALALTSDPIERARIAPELAVALEYRGRPGDAVAVLDEAIDALPDTHPEIRGNLLAQAVVAANTFLKAHHALRDRVIRARTELPDLSSPQAGPLLAALAHEISHRDGTAAEVGACAERALASGLGTTSLWDGVVVIVAAEALSRCDRLTRAEAVLDALLASARARGATQLESSTLTARAAALSRAGRLLEAEADARMALELARDGPRDFLKPYKLAQLADALIERGQLEAAAHLLTPSELTRLDADESFFDALLHDARARLLARQGRFQEALDEARRVERADREWDISNPGWTAWRPTAALIHHRLGDPEQAADLAAEELRAARAFGAARALGIALRTAGLVSGAEIDQLQEAVAVLNDSEARLEHARTLVELGAALRRTGHRTDARGPLRLGLELAHQCGALALAEFAHQELLATGARPRRPRSSGRDALTPSEVRIAGMAAEGLTNREIAQALYLSLKTVEMHLSHTYRKLDIQTRAQLPRALGQGQSTGL